MELQSNLNRNRHETAQPARWAARICARQRTL